MRILFDRKFLVAGLLAALPFVVVACFTEARGWALTGFAVLILLATIASGSREERCPQIADTERFLVNHLALLGFGGAARVSGTEHRLVPGSAPDCVHVHFRATVTITEPLYQTTVPPADLCGSLSPRRLEALTRRAAQLAAEHANVAGSTVPPPPPDPFARQYIVARSEAGWALEIAGTARATHSSRHGWHYALTHAPREFELLVQTGRPRDAWAEAIVLDSAEGRAWLQENAAAWTAFEAELGRLRGTLEQYRARRSVEALSAFFRAHGVGACFEGVGESLTRQNPPQRFILEFTSVDRSRHRVRFTLRRDWRAPRARTFNAQVEQDGTSDGVRLTAETLAADALPDGGPLLGAAAPFTLEFVWDPADSSRLTGRGADFSFTFQASPAAALRATLAAPEPKAIRRPVDAVAPGSCYTSDLGAGAQASRVRLTFVSGEAGALEARFEGRGWSMHYAVRPTAESPHSEASSLLLDPLSVPILAGAVGAGGTETWPRLRLRVVGGELVGVIENGTSSAPIRFRRESGLVPTPTRPAAPASA